MGRADGARAVGGGGAWVGAGFGEGGEGGGARGDGDDGGPGVGQLPEGFEFGLDGGMGDGLAELREGEAAGAGHGGEVDGGVEQVLDEGERIEGRGRSRRGGLLGGGVVHASNVRRIFGFARGMFGMFAK